MSKYNILQSSAARANSAEGSEQAQVVPAVSYRRTNKDRHLFHLVAAALGVNILLLSVSTDAFTSPTPRHSCAHNIQPEVSSSTSSSSASASALFVASMPKKNTDANPVFGREGGADSVGLQSGLGADASRIDASEMTSILDDGSGHVNAELAQSIWQWGK